MTIVSSYVGQVKPGRFAEVAEINEIGKKLLERHGAQGVRFLRAAVAAEGYTSAVTSFEFPTAEQWGQFYDEVMEDDEMISLIARSEGVDSPYTSTMVTMSTDITPRPSKSTATGKIVDVFISRPNPGRFEDCLSLAADASALFEKLGGTNTRLLQQSIAGSQTELLIWTCEWESMRALGRALDKSQDDKLLERITAATLSATPPLTLVSHEAYADISG